MELADPDNFFYVLLVLPKNILPGTSFTKQVQSGFLNTPFIRKMRFSDIEIY